jgi:arabinogalactan endo-1,4-beta-galactosidase
MNMSKLLLYLLAAIPSLVTASKLAYRGVDVSFLPQVEEAGGVFYDSLGEERPFLEILQENCINLARVNIWHTPFEGCCSLEQALTLAKRLQAHDIDILLDFHYSDTWADPSQQTKPEAWKDLNFDDLKSTLRNYTRDVMVAFYQQGIEPVAVQLGNEVRGGARVLSICCCHCSCFILLSYHDTTL